MGTEGGRLAPRLGKQYFDPITHWEKTPSFSSGLGKFCVILRYTEAGRPPIPRSPFPSNHFYSFSALQCTLQDSQRDDPLNTTEKKTQTKIDWILLSEWPKYSSVWLPSSFLGEKDSRYLENNTHGSKESWCLREPDKGELTKFNKTAFVSVTCNLQRADAACLWRGWVWNGVTQPVWSSAAFPRHSFLADPREAGWGIAALNVHSLWCIIYDAPNCRYKLHSWRAV